MFLPQVTSGPEYSSEDNESANTVRKVIKYRAYSSFDVLLLEESQVSPERQSLRQMVTLSTGVSVANLPSEFHLGTAGDCDGLCCAPVQNLKTCSARELPGCH